MWVNCRCTGLSEPLLTIHAFQSPFCSLFNPFIICPGSHIRDIGKQCRPRSDATEHGV